VDARRPRGEGRAPAVERPVPRPAGPELPEWVDTRELDPAVRAALRGLDPRNAERVAGHLMAAGTLVDDDPEAALEHARAARDRASRVAAVREAVGVAAYHAGDYAEAAREIRAYRRMSGDPGYRAVLADCERGLGRPEVALRLVTEALGEGPEPDEVVELRLVEAGARRDLGEVAAARLVLEDALGGRPRPEALDPAAGGRLRLAVAYADLLRSQGEEELAERWTSAVVELAPDLLEDAEERLGVTFGEEELPELPDDGSHARPGEDAAPGASRSFDEDVEAEVAELLGELPDDEPDGQADDATEAAADDREH
jgi:tetratricopeptide (TPR) repeat protein